jgi:CDAN1-interacting nuclease 1
MLQSEYDALIPRLRTREDVAAAAAAGPYAYETLQALYEQAYMRQQIRSAHLAKRHGAEFVRRFDRGMSLVDVAEWVNLSPCMVARRFLELKLGVGRQAVTRMLREPGKWIEDVRVREAVVECVESDEHAGPFMDRQRAVVGVEGEFVLMERLRNVGLEFETEADLRARGTHKTPDVLLCVPVAFCGRVVCWIDSKGKFGDEYFLRKDYTDAVSSYVGRFGPGMVVYWAGFIEDCNTPMLNDSGVLVTDCVPDDIVMLPGTARPAFVDDPDEPAGD